MPTYAIGDIVLTAVKNPVAIRSKPTDGTVDVIGSQPIKTEGRVIALLTNGYIGVAFVTPPSGWVWAANLVPKPIGPVPVPSLPPIRQLPLLTDAQLAKTVVFRTWHESDRYERFQHLDVRRKTTESIGFQGFDFFHGGALRALEGTTYTLLVDGAAMATATVVTGTVRSAFSLDCTTIAQGWHDLDILVPGSEIPIPWTVYFYRGQPIVEPLMPIIASSYDVARQRIAWTKALVPTQFNPTPRPLTPRFCPTFNTPDSYTTLFRTNVAVGSNDTITRPNVNADGLMSTFNIQAYFFSTLVAKYPKVALLDGARGRGTTMMPTHITVGDQGEAYWSDPWRLAETELDGSVRTIAGYRHDSIAKAWESPPNVELVGDWSGIPAARRGFHEIWGFAKDERVGQFRTFVADSQNNRVCVLAFNPADEDLPPIVSEFLVNLPDAWDVALDGAELYVSVRGLHRINVYDADTAAFLRTEVQGAGMGLAHVDASRFVVLEAPIDQIRAQDCVLPEGLFIQDGVLSFGSRAQAWVSEKVLATGELRKGVIAPYIDGNSHFVKITRSDGSFGPRGTTFVSTWSLVPPGGMPEAFLPGGGKWNWYTHTYMSCGRGGQWHSLGYSSSCGIGRGRLYCGSSQEGLVMISKALPTDPAPNYALFRQGELEYAARGLQLVCGPEGYGYHGFSAFGLSAAIDYFLSWNGHTP